MRNNAIRTTTPVARITDSWVAVRAQSYAEIINVIDERYRDDNGNYSKDIANLRNLLKRRIATAITTATGETE